MAISITHSPVADGSFTPTGKTAWDNDHQIAGTSATVDIFVNSFGFGFGNTAPSNSDDFIHIQRDVNEPTGINIRNDSTGALAEGYIHLWGGPLSGSTGSGLRVSANSAAGGSLVDIVAHNNLAFSIIQQSAAPLDFYVNNLRMMQFISTASTVNYHTFKGSSAGSSVIESCDGTDTDINKIIDTKGAGSFFVRTAAGASFQFEVQHVASASRRVVVKGSNGTNPAITVSAGELAVGTNAWTFGIANSVSPTSPNRTLTITIGATTYYIHAKTTND